MGLTRIAITRPLAMLMFILGLIIMGGISYRMLRVDRLPNISFPFVSVSVSWPGASPEDVEQYILKPVEGAVAGLPGVSQITSSASSGNGRVSIQLADGYDTNTAAIDIERQVSAIRNRLPSDAGVPTVNKLDPNAQPILNIAISGGQPLDVLYDLASNTLQPKLQAVPGVANVSISGGLQREVQIQADLSKLAAYGVSLSQIQSAIVRENVSSPAGNFTQGTGTINLRANGQFQSAEDLGNVVISSTGNQPNGQVTNGGGVTLKQVATITDGYKQVTSIQRFNGQEAVGMSITKQSDANSLAVADSVKALIAEMNQQLPPGVQVTVVNDTSTFTRESLDAVQLDLGIAILLTAMVLLLFLHSWRNVVIVILAIPTSLISTFLVMYALHISLNTITLMALALAIGILVDDSIVVIENIHRHLHLGEGPMVAALNGRSEIGMAAVAITLVDVVVYLPIAFMAGNIGQLFREYGITIAVATLFSLFISFTLTPMIASRVMKEHNPDEIPGALTRFGDWLDESWERVARVYGRVLRVALHVRPLVLLIALLALGGALSLIPLKVLSTEYTPSEDDSQMSVNVQMPVGTSLDRTDQVAKQMEALLSQTPEVDQIFTSINSGGGGFGGGGSSANIAVQLKDKSQRSRSIFDVINDLRTKTRQFQAQGANVQFSVQNPLSGGRGGLQIMLLGDDYATLTKLSQDVAKAIQDVPGVADVRAPQVAGQPELQAVANRAAMADLGISEQTVATTLRTAVAGATVSSLQPQGELQRDITLIAQPSDRNDPSKLASMPIVNNGVIIHLGQIASIEQTTTPVSISRQDRQRILSVNANVSGRPLGDIANDVRAAVANVPRPAGYQILVGGSVQNLDTALASLLSALGMSVLLIYMLMVALYENWLHPLTIMFALPLALIGAFLGLVLTGNTLNLYSIIGIIMLMGLVAKNGILLVDYTNTLRARGMNRLDALLEAAPTRLKPIAMTSSTIVMAMIPLALRLESGAESRSPLAVVVIGGVISSTLLTLFVVPTMYTYLDSFGALVGRVIRRLTSQAPKRASLVTPTGAVLAAVTDEATVRPERFVEASALVDRPRFRFGFRRDKQR